MAFVYVLYSASADKFYIGSTQDLEQRLIYHHTKKFKNSFTSKYTGWELFLSVEVKSNATARKIELHIKKMKSRTYLVNLKRYPEMIEKLNQKYS